MDKLKMIFQILATMTSFIHVKFTAADFTTFYHGLEMEALIVMCSRNSGVYPVEWYDTKNNIINSTQGKSRIFASGKYLKFLPAEVSDTGIYTCIVKSPTSNKTGDVNVTIYEKQPGCNIPEQLIYAEISGSEKDSRIYCPTATKYNWTEPIEWFKNCKPLQGPKYQSLRTSLIIVDATSNDTGDYTCKFKHNENGVYYNVSATRAYKYEEKRGFISSPMILAPAQNEIKEVEIGGKILLNCTACFGKSIQSIALVEWHVNSTNIKNFGEARFQEEPGKYEGNDMACLSKHLTVVDIKEEDLLLKYDCFAHNTYGGRTHTIGLKKKQSKDC